MSIVAGSGNQLSITRCHRLVPALQVLCRAREEICEHQIGIAAIRSKRIKKHHERICDSRVGEQIVNIKAVDGTRLPVLGLDWISGQRYAAESFLPVDHFSSWQ